MTTKYKLNFFNIGGISIKKLLVLTIMLHLHLSVVNAQDQSSIDKIPGQGESWTIEESVDNHDEFNINGINYKVNYRESNRFLLPNKEDKPNYCVYGCGGCLLLGGIFAYFIYSAPEGGVKLDYNMDKYAIDYIESHNILDSTENILAYYDITISMNSNECAIITNHRVIYHKKGSTISIPLKDIYNVEHIYKKYFGDFIIIYSVSGQSMVINIAPFNGGDIFLNILMTSWEKTKQRP